MTYRFTIDESGASDMDKSEYSYYNLAVKVKTSLNIIQHSNTGLRTLQRE